MRRRAFSICKVQLEPEFVDSINVCYAESPNPQATIMIFFLQDPGWVKTPPGPFPCCVLRRDNWNDYSYRTYFQSFIFISQDEHIELGNVRIMRLGQQVADTTFDPKLDHFEGLQGLQPPHCSLGENLDYYRRLSSLEEAVWRPYLEGLNDIAFNPQLKEVFSPDPCFQISLLRYTSSVEAMDKGGAFFAVSTPMVSSFTASLTLPNAAAAHLISFDFDEAQGLPHRSNMLVGLNGVGKTQVMARLAILLSRYAQADQDGTRDPGSPTVLVTAGKLSPIPSIYAVISISFSAFDSFELPTTNESERFRYSYCGLRTRAGQLRTEDDLVSEITATLAAMPQERIRQLIEAIPSLIHVEDIASFITNPDQHAAMYDNLSAGQRIALNIICHLFSKLQTRSLVLFDEPELHLHPQLMSTMLSIVYDALTLYDSFAIVATHSPVVVQQVPSRFIHIIQRHGAVPAVVQPQIECFGQNLSELTRSVFNAVESDRDYEQVIDRLLAENEGDASQVEALFPAGLGLNARIYLRSRAAGSRR